MTKTEIRDSLVKQLELRGMNAEFYKDMIDDYVYYWSLKKKLISDIKSKGLRYKTIHTVTLCLRWHSRNGALRLRIVRIRTV